MSLVVNVYGYDVHYTKKSNGIIMYYAADIVRQFNTKNGKKKRFTHCLELKETKELIQVIAIICTAYLLVILKKVKMYLMQ